MIRTLQVRNFRCLRDVNIRFDEKFHVLVGPNGSGKSTLFDAIQFIFDLVGSDLQQAVAKRTQNFQDLVWARTDISPGFEIAVEIDLCIGASFRYEVRVEENANGLTLAAECGYLGCLTEPEFDELKGRNTVFSQSESRALTPVFRRLPSNAEPRDDHVRTTFYPEGQLWQDPVTLGHRDGPSIRLVPAFNELRLIQDDQKVQDERGRNLPTATAAVGLLGKGAVQFLQLDSRVLRLASAPNGSDGLRWSSDGGGLPWVIETFREAHEDRFQDWLRHLRTALRDISDIRTVRRADDRHAYLMIRRSDGVEIPSWAASEGTLRLLVLTLLAYLPDAHPVAYLLEEPENGIHPMAIETAYQSLSSVYDSQVLVASHSPTFLRCVKPKEVLCFSNLPDGSTKITRGDIHPRLVDWQASADNDLFFAAEILG